MCGIAGLSLVPGSDLELPPILTRMVAVQNHRGPDAKGTWLCAQDKVGLAHNRLSILDLSDAGHQPMHSADGLLSIVFNGEIYNWRDLRVGLESRGVCFRTGTDTEVLLEAYRQHGCEVLAFLRGMYAFALYDARDRTLFCARDRVGKKPFVYSETEAGFAFASEIPAVLQVPGCDTRIHHGALAAMLLHNIRQIPDPYTVYRGLRRLRPGHAMIVREGRIVRNWRYWQPTPDPEPPTPQRLRAILEEAVALRMEADVPVGALLSGGVDSSAVVHLMSRRSAAPVRTYALGLDAHDEDLRRARIMANKLGCIHKEFYFDAGRELETLRTLIATYGEPIMLLPLVHTYELARAIRDDGLKVVLAGHGADELFYGYTGHARTALFSTLEPWLAPLAPLIRMLPMTSLPEPLVVLAAKPGARKAALYRATEETAWTCLDHDVRNQLKNLLVEELAYWGMLIPPSPYIDESNFVSLLIENAHSVTIASDLPAMLASIEMRAPFLDQRVVSFALATPYRQKVASFWDTTRLKQILKLAVSDLVPDDLLYAPKRGFGYDIKERAVLQGPWRQSAKAAFEDSDDAEGLFDRKALRELWYSHDNGAVRSDLVARHFAVQLWLSSRKQSA